MKDFKNLSLPLEGESKIDLFRKKEIRKTIHESEWWFSVKDVLEALVDTPDGTRYASDLRKRDKGLNATYSEITRTLPFETETRGIQKITFIDIEGVFRLMQSVPSKKAEPFKKWLAKVGFERLQEIKNPEIAIKRVITTYRAKGFDDDWIDARISNKASHELLTAEWQKRGMIGYVALLTDAIAVKTFGVSVAEHKNIKGLKSQGLRDNMTPIELTLTTLGEQATKEITTHTNPNGVHEHMNAAKQGGSIAGSARNRIEKATGKKVVSPKNYLTVRQRENNAKLGVGAFDETVKRLLKT